MYLGQLFGIPLHVHISVVALFVGFMGWVAWSMGLGSLPAGLLLAVGIFWAIVLHELGHALAARAYGIRTAHITLYPFGGVAALEQEARSAKEELLIAAAGPAVNGLLFVAFGLLWGAVGWRFLLVNAALNLLLMLYNLLPAYPMDGGRMLRAWLSTRMGWFEASKRAIQIGSFFGWGFVLIGLLYPSMSSLLTGVMLLGALHVERKRLTWMWTFDRDQAGYDR